MRYPLVEMHGNNGTMTGDSAAASRYTEIRLSKIGMLMCKGIEKDIEPTQLNYSGEEYEPTLMPSEFPNVLVNPNLGIAVAMACNTYPHNLNEMCAALNEYLEKGDAYTIDDFLTKVKGPDFPTGGIVLNGETMKDIYSTGRGSLKVQSKYYLETVKGKVNIVITEIPYLITMEKFTTPIRAAMEEEGSMFDDIQDNLGNKGFELRIILAKGADTKKAIEFLRKETGFESNLKFNNTLLVAGKPRQMSIIETMKLFINHRHRMIITEAQKDKDKAEERVNIIDGLLIAIQDIDGVVAIIKKAANKDEARTKLMEKYKLNSAQANAILDMKLSRLTSLDTKKLVDERAELIDQIQLCNHIIEDKTMRDQMIKDSLNNIAKEFGDDRRTEIKINTENVAVETISEPKNYYLCEDGSLSTETPVRYKYVIKARQAKEIAYYNNGDTITFSPDMNSTGMFIYKNAPYLLCLTKNGKIKKTSTSEFKQGKDSKCVKLAEGDELLLAGMVDDNDYVLILTEHGVLKLAAKDITATGKSTQGVKACEGTILAACIASDADQILLATESTQAKITNVRDLSVGSRGTKGNSVFENTKYMINVTQRSSVLLIAKTGKDVEFDVSKLAVKGKNAKGAAMSTKIITKII